MSYLALHTRLTNLLQTVKDAPGSLLPMYFPYEEPAASNNVTSFPYAQLIIKESTEEPLDTRSNTGRYTFVIRVISIHESRATLETTMLTLADQILAELRKMANQTLSGDAYKFFPFTVAWGFESNTTAAPLRFFDIDVTAETIHDI